MPFLSFSSCALALAAASFSKSLPESPFVSDDTEEDNNVSSMYESGKKQYFENGYCSLFKCLCVNNSGISAFTTIYTWHNAIISVMTELIAPS